MEVIKNERIFLLVMAEGISLKLMPSTFPAVLIIPVVESQCSSNGSNAARLESGCITGFRLVSAIK